MAAVHAIKVSNRYSAAACGRRQSAKVANDVHGKGFATEDTETTERSTN
jgi:hypothetical protein